MVYMLPGNHEASEKSHMVLGLCCVWNNELVLPSLQEEDPVLSPWPKKIQDHILGECRKCQAIIADHISYGRNPNKNNPTLCECCTPEESREGEYRGNHNQKHHQHQG